MERRKGTTTKAFGSGLRESHDASPFYSRFAIPELSDDARLVRCSAPNTLYCRDARLMADSLEENSVALVVTSPPYYAGKEYELALGQGCVPGSYIDYLQMLTEVFRACARVLEPGGRMAINVANLGRKPFRSLASDVMRILQDELRLLPRGEIVWVKAEGASGSCAWGSFCSPSNPSLRDLTERILVVSKGRFDRALTRQERQKKGYPHEPTISKELFMEATLDVWRIRTESAKRVGHPAPFPVELPARLIELHTYKGDLVLDPFLGSGTTAVAAAKAGRSYVGFDTQPDYIRLADQRLQNEAGSHPSLVGLDAGIEEPV